MNTIEKSRNFFLTIATLLAAMVLSGCGYHYKCGITFGASTCTPSGGGSGSTGNIGSSAAFLYNIVGSGKINGVALLAGSSGVLENIQGFTAPTVPSGDTSAEVVIAQKKFLYAAFPGSQKLFAWSIDATSGNLTAVSGSPFTIATLGNVILNSARVNMTAIAVNPAGTFLFIAAASAGAIDAYQIGSTGTLTHVPGAPFNTIGTIQPWNLYFDGLGKYLYVTTGPEGAGQQVAAYAIQSSGALNLVPGSPFGFNLWQLQGEPSGNYMIGISGSSAALNTGINDTSLYVFSITQSGTNAGALTQVSGSPFLTLSAPVNIAVQPDANNGNFIYSFSGTSAAPGSIEGYQLDITTGALTAMPHSPFRSIGSGGWGQFDQSGTNLFIYSNNDVTPAVAALSVAVGTGGLTEPGGPLVLDSGTTFLTVTDRP